MDSGIFTKDGKIEAYVFEQHVDDRGIDAVKRALASAPGVEFVAQFVGGFNLFARVVADDLAQLRGHIAGEYFDAGIRSDWSVNLTAERDLSPKRHSPNICAMVRVQTTTVDPFALLGTLDALFGSVGDYGLAVVTASDYDVLVDLGADTLPLVIERVKQLRGVDGIGRTSTALADLAGNAIRLAKS